MELRTRNGGNLRVGEQRSLTGAPMGQGGTIVDPATIPPFPGYGRQVAGIPVNDHTALQVPAVFSALRIICFTVGKLGDPIAYVEELDTGNVRFKRRVPDDIPILSDTFGYEAGLGPMPYDGRTRTVASMALFGEAWWEKINPDRQGTPEAVRVLNPQWIERKRNPDGSWRLFYGGSGWEGVDERELDPKLLLHIPLWARPQDQRGLPAVRYLGVAMGLALASLQFASLFFSQGASPGFVLTTDQSIGEAEARRLVEKFLVEHAGISQAHLPMLFDKGLKPTKISSSPDEAQLTQVHQAATSMIAAYFGVPEVLMGVATDSRVNPYAAGATDEMLRQFESTCLVGYLTALNDAHTRLLPPGRGWKAEFDETRLLRPGAQQQAKLITAMRQMNVASINEIRTRYLGLPPIDGGDEVIAPLASNTAPSDARPDDGIDDAAS